MISRYSSPSRRDPSPAGRLVRNLFLAAGIFLSLLNFSAYTQAQENKANLVVILDGSGSMWGLVGAERKIAAAKRVMGEVLKDVPAHMRMGFVAYGHRRKGDCRDIETIGTLGTAPDRIASAVKRIQPTGKTPISDALRHASKLLQQSDAPSTILLVSDGIETCQGDPCAIAKELRASGIKLVIHTVGFGVGDKAARQLQCIAKEGGGNYYPAHDSAALQKALFTVKKAVAEQKAPPPVEPVKVATPEKLKTKRIKIAGPGTIKLKLAPWAKLPYRWHAVDPETGERKATVSKYDRVMIRKGEYQIVWRQSEHHSTNLPLSEVVNVPAGKMVTVAIDTGLELVPPEGLKAPYWWGLAREGERKTFVRFYRREGMRPQVVPAGTYRLIWHQNEHGSTPVDLGPVTIEPGKLNRHRLERGVQISLAEWVPGPPYRLDLVSTDGKRIVRWQRKLVQGVQLAPMGTYRLRYHQNEHGYSPIDLGTVTIPKTGFAEIKVNTGVKFIPSSEETEPPYKAIFVNLDTKKEYVWSSNRRKGWKPVPLPPGRYRLDWWQNEHKTKRMTLVDEFELEPGVLAELEM